MTRYEALKAVRAQFPSEQAMAEAFGVSQPTVWRWLNQSKQLPAEHCQVASSLTGVALNDLRPDVYSRGMMVDRMAGHRFEGVDRNAGPFPHDTRVCADRRAPSSGNSAEISLSRAG